jgi:hypothetical protein
MTKHLDSQGNEIEPRPDFPAQDLWDRMGLAASAPVTVGPLSEAHKAILSEPQTLDRREFDLCVQSGQGLRVAFEKAAAVSGNSSLRKAKSTDFLEADTVLREFQETHDKKTLHEQLAPLVERACAKLSKENGELLRKAHAVLDLSILTYYLGRAFA